jgi:hypothetical protein
MSFRKKNKQERAGRQKWDSFCEANRELMERIGLTTPTMETQERFEDFLMHGYIDHHDDWSKFSVDKLDPARYELFKLLVDKYCEAGYADPGLMAVSHEERARLARKYPRQFHPSIIESANRQLEAMEE